LITGRWSDAVQGLTRMPPSSRIPRFLGFAVDLPPQGLPAA
jgi:hypothetical protein